MTRWSLLLMAAALSACDDFEPSVREVGPGVLAVKTAPDVTLEVLDWGGSGPTLVFLAGGGHTAHEFDEFAPRLTGSHRAVGITRRGIGESAGSAPTTSRDHVTDIAKVLTALGLEAVVLVGHSQGGLEAAEFARTHPDRCRGIVHLDAAYLEPWNPPLEEIFRSTPPPPTPPMTRADSASVAAVQAWIQRTQGFRLPGSEIRAVNRFDKMGRVVGRAPRTTTPEPGSLIDGFVAALHEIVDRPLRWESIGCPALGLYAVTAPLESWLPHYAARQDSLGAEERDKANAYVRAFSGWTAAQREAFGKLPHNEVVEFPATGHYFFLEQPEQERALAEIREFVAGLKSGAAGPSDL